MLESAAMSLLYPVAATAEAALHAPLGFAARAREAALIAADAVRFITEPVGPAFVSPEAAEAAYATVDGAQGRQLIPVTSGTPEAPRRPVFRDGRRWPEPDVEPVLLWRLSLSYWRIGLGEACAPPPQEAARKMRRSRTSHGLDAGALAALARQPLRAVRPQQPLDVGLFEVRPPEAPDTLIPDE